MPEERTSTRFSGRVADDITEMMLNGASLDEINFWMDHHLRGTWFTSNLLRLFSQADSINRKKLMNAFPAEGTMWQHWQDQRALTGSREK